MAGVLYMPRVVALTARAIRRRWLTLLVAIPVLAVTNDWLWSLLPLQGGMASGAQIAVTGLGYAHFALSQAVVAGLVSAAVLLNAPSPAERLRQAVGAVAGGFGGLLVFGLLVTAPVLAGNLVLLAATPNVALQTPDFSARLTTAVSITLVGRLALMMVVQTFWATLPGAAVVERATPLRAFDRAFHLTEGARLAIGGGWLLFAVVAVAPVRFLTKGLLTLAPMNMATFQAGQLVLALSDVVWLTAAAVIYRELSTAAGAGAVVNMAEVFD